MSFWVAGAVVVGNVASGAMAADASKDAAKAGADASGRASAQVQAAADQARRDANMYIPAAQRDLLAGYSGAADIFGAGLPEQQRLLGGGNMNAQQTIAGGYNQYQNALLGMPVDQSNWQPREVAPSAPIQNPFTGDQGLQFTDIGALPMQQAQQQLGGITNNRDVFQQLAAGSLNLPGLTGAHSDWARNLLNAPRAEGDYFLSGNSIMNASGQPGRADQMVNNSGFNAGNQQMYSQILNALARAQGG